MCETLGCAVPGSPGGYKGKSMTTLIIFLCFIIVYTLILKHVLLEAHQRGVENKKLFPSASEVVEAIRTLGNDVTETVNRKDGRELNEFET